MRNLELLVVGALVLGIVVVSGVIAARGDECRPAKPSNQRGQYWSYRVVDNKTCWYAGRPGRSKSRLHWATPVRVVDAPSVNPVGIVGETAVSPPSVSNDPDGTFLREWCDIMSDLAGVWWRDRAEVKDWTGVLSGGR
jgi:hypothetical protein